MTTPSQPAAGKATPRPTLVELARNLKIAAWTCGTDEYREGVSDSACRRRAAELDNAENALNDALAAQSAAVDAAVKGLQLIASFDGLTNLDPESVNDVDYGRGAAYAYAECAKHAAAALAAVESKGEV